MKQFRYAASLALAIMAVFGLAGRVAADDQVPLNGAFEGERTERIPLTPTTVFDRWEMEGVATNLGTFDLVVEVVVDFGGFPVTAVGTATLVAANGDKVFADFSGYSVPDEPGFVVIVENAVITGGTGRYAGATGSYTSSRLTSLTTNETIGAFKGTISTPSR